MFPSILTVTAPAATTTLCELSRLKSELKITDDSADADLTAMLARATGRIVEYCGIAQASDGTRNLGTEVLVETIRLPNRWPSEAWSAHRMPEELILKRRPVLDIASIVEDGITLDPTSYEASLVGGILTRLSSDDLPIHWRARKVVVTYTAGWKLPGEDGRNLPSGAEDVCLALAKAEYFSGARDPAVKTVRIEGVSERSYYMRGDAPVGGMEPALSQVIDSSGLVEHWF